MSWSRKRKDTTEHAYTEERLSTYLDGALSPREQAAVDAHLATCEACRWNFDTLRRTVQWTRELPTVPVPRVFTIPVPAEPVRAPRGRWGFLPALQVATALVAVLLVFSVAGEMMLGTFPARLSPQPGAVMEQQVEEVVEAIVVEEVELEKEVAVPPPEVGIARETPAAAPAEGMVEKEAAFTVTPGETAVGGGETAAPAAEEAAISAGAEEERKAAEAVAATAVDGTTVVEAHTADAAEPELQTQPAAERAVQPTSAAPGEMAAPAAPTLQSRGTPVSAEPTAAPSVSATPTMDAATVAAEPLGASLPAVQDASAPTDIARASGPRGGQEQRSLHEAQGSLEDPVAIGLRTAVIVLAVSFVVLATVTAAAMIRRRRVG
jgi:anti-sigma factor RsiW